jgi:preprotein translocase subunit SecE
MEKLITYVKLSKVELSKVIFPLKEQVKNAFIAVFAVVTVIAIFLALIDLLMSFSISRVVS